MNELTFEDHDRDSAGLTYVYPVVSRRSRGLSIGINLSPNKACNWRCIYCQVPGLIRGAPPATDLVQLESELDSMLGQVLEGDFLERHVPSELRRLNDIAFSGDGEPTLAPNFREAIEVVSRLLHERDLVRQVDVVLITNGSRVLETSVARGLTRLSQLGGQVWFKLDCAGRERRLEINDTRAPDDQVLERLGRCALLCPTRIQTCVFAVDGEPPTQEDRARFVELLRHALDRGIRIRDLLLYGLARESRQPEAPRLGRLPAEWLQDFAAEIEPLGLRVSVHP